MQARAKVQLDLAMPHVRFSLQGACTDPDMTIADLSLQADMLKACIEYDCHRLHVQVSCILCGTLGLAKQFG